ncbi:hypothetical protein HGRIS_007309 [Hohenbuehelia grisea]|uniref:Uncharacterized protein n=1 Tax=Hohenbuehelia grisea TaxID=104357 RepID=A0ABR3J5T9_9AGAR
MVSLLQRIQIRAQKSILKWSNDQRLAVSIINIWFWRRNGNTPSRQPRQWNRSGTRACLSVAVGIPGGDRALPVCQRLDHLESLIPRLAHYEYKILVQLEASRCCMEHVEGLFMDMMTSPNCSEKYGIPIMDSDESWDDVEARFIQRQVKNLSSTLGNFPPMFLPTQAIPPPGMLDVLFRNEFVNSRWTCGEALGDIARATRSCTSWVLLQDDLFAIFKASWIALSLCWNEEAAQLYQSLTGITCLLYRNNRSIEFQRLLAHAVSLASSAILRLHHHDAISVGNQGATLWQDVYDRSGDPRDLSCLIHALSQYEIACFRQGHLEESLDLSRQALLLMRSIQESDEEGVMVRWSASGEADVVFSSRRHISQPSRYAFAEARCLWNLAKGLAFLGRYTEAHIAAVDALSCLRAYLSVTGQPAGQCIVNRWCVESSSWVGIPRALNPLFPSQFTPPDDTTKPGAVLRAAKPMTIVQSFASIQQIALIYSYSHIVCHKAFLLRSTLPHAMQVLTS